MKYILSFILLITTLSGFSQETATEVDPYSEDVKRCIASNGTVLYYENVVDQMFGVLKQQFESQNVPESVWTALQTNKQVFIDEISQMIVSAYRAHFTHQDVKNMNAFYATNAGKKMFKKASELSDKDKAEITTFYQTDTGQKIVGSQDSMNNAMLALTEDWSSDAYKTIIDKLSEKGYNL